MTNLLTGILATIVLDLSFRLAGGSNEKYFNAVLTVALLFTTLAYVVIFPTVVKLRYSHPDVPRPYRVPFGMPGVWACAILTTFWALLATVVGFFPGLGDGMLLNDRALPKGFTRAEFQLVVLVPLLVTLGIGCLFYVLGRRTREEIAQAPSRAGLPEADAS